MARKTTNTQKSKPTPRKAGSARKTAPVARPKKPLFSMGTWITVILLIGLIAAAWYINRNKETASAEATPTGAVTNLFSADEGNVSSIEIKPADGESVKVARNAENVWALEMPVKTEADQGMAEAAATQISALQVVSELDGDPETYGLDTPAYVVTIKFAGGKEHSLEIGDMTVTASGYYVRLDQDKMMIIDLSGIESLLNLVNFPPYLNTPTPTSLPPTETPVPPSPTEEIPTLEATVTPTP